MVKNKNSSKQSSYIPASLCSNQSTTAFKKTPPHMIGALLRCTNSSLTRISCYRLYNELPFCTNVIEYFARLAQAIVYRSNVIIYILDDDLNSVAAFDVTVRIVMSLSYPFPVRNDTMMKNSVYGRHW